ncbi:hypothetical protein HYALB_00006614 [Hymenoscyphus albidus]|uniref:Uncharacterized protein n=1 Tax=Hymenoscyphus albidus TaxID=595503 RepID=A0A9N9LSK8_9HELO|nr:hypothetical protein HYALB_00006614 [Hymenoscyphus albidus]
MSLAITEKGTAGGSAETIPANSQNMLIGPEKNATVAPIPYSSFTKSQPNIAPSLGLVLGGVLSEYVKTCRPIVGNSSIATDWQYQPLFSLFCQRHMKRPRDNDVEPLQKRKFHIPNHVSCLKLLFNKSTSLIVLVNGIFCIQAYMSSLFIELYGFNKLKAGLIYLPFGAGCALASFFSGTFTSVYARQRSYDSLSTDEIQTNSPAMTRFPIEKARYRSICHPIPISSACIAGYDWALQTHVSVAVPLILQFLIGAMVSVVYNLCGTLLVDLHPRSPTSAQAALNIVRCTLSAGGLALLQLVIDRVGVGWCFTIFVGLCLSMIFPVLVLLRYGMSWRTPAHTSR